MDERPTDTSVIPLGDYCYTIESVDLTTGRITTKPCPYWRLLPGKEPQSNGYCAFLGRGDWDEVDYSTEPPGVIRGTSLLWDGCKECGENLPEESP